MLAISFDLCVCSNSHNKRIAAFFVTKKANDRLAQNVWIYWLNSITYKTNSYKIETVLWNYLETSIKVAFDVSSGERLLLLPKTSMAGVTQNLIKRKLIWIAIVRSQNIFFLTFFRTTESFLKLYEMKRFKEILNRTNYSTDLCCNRARQFDTRIPHFCIAVGSDAYHRRNIRNLFRTARKFLRILNYMENENFLTKMACRVLEQFFFFISAFI